MRYREVFRTLGYEYSLTRQECSNICEVYNIDTNVWEKAPSLLIPRVKHSSCTLNGKLYVFGGITWHFICRALGQTHGHKMVIVTE